MGNVVKQTRANIKDVIKRVRRDEQQQWNQIRRDLLKALQACLTRIQQTAQQIKNERQRTSIIQSAELDLEVLRELPRHMDEYHKTVPFVQRNILLLEHGVAVGLHGFDSPEAQKALERQLKFEYEQEMEKTFGEKKRP